MNKREEILEAAYEILGSDGLEGLHARTVAAAVDVNHAAVHYYFPHRSDLLVGVLEFAAEKLAADREKAKKAAKGKTGVDTELAFLEAQLKPSSRFFHVWLAFVTAANHDAALKTALNSALSDWANELKSALEGKKSKKSSAMAEPVNFMAIGFGIGVIAQALGPKTATKVLDALRKELK